MQTATKHPMLPARMLGELWQGAAIHMAFFLALSSAEHACSSQVQAW